MAPMGKEQITVNRRRLENVVRRALEARQGEKGPISMREVPPVETEFVKLVKAHGEEIDNPAYAATAVFLTTAFDFGGVSRTLFNKIADPDEFFEYSWLFEPWVVAKCEPYEVQEACDNYFGPGGYNIFRTAPEYWHNCNHLVQEWDGDIRNFFEHYDNDAVEVTKALVVKPRARNKRGFRRYGPKTGTLAIERIVKHGLHPLKNADQLDVPVDFQKARILIQTFALGLQGAVNTHWVTMVARQELRRVCDKNGWHPEEVSDALYTLGNTMCNRRMHENCPVARQCKIMLSRDLYDKGGIFVQEDQAGRFDEG